MGLFTRDRVITVTASAQTMGGDWRNRANLMTTMIVDQALFNSYGSFANGYLQTFVFGAGKALTGIPSRADRLDYYDYTGQTKQATYHTQALDEDIVLEELEMLSIENAVVGRVDITNWGERYLLQYFPLEIEDYVNVELDEETNELIITGSTDRTFPIPPDYDPNGQYLYALGLVEAPDALVDSTTLTEHLDELPADWILVYEPEPEEYTWTESGTFTTEEDPTPIAYTRERSVTLLNGSSTSVEEHALNGEQVEVGEDEDGNPIYESEEPPDGYQDITTTREYVVTLEPAEQVEYTEDGITYTATTNAYEVLEHIQETKQTDTIYRYKDGRLALKIYQRGTGNPTLDALIPSGSPTGLYYPVIPIKVDIKPGKESAGNPKYVDDKWDYLGLDELYAMNKRLTKPSMGRKGYADIVDSAKEGIAEAKRLQALKTFLALQIAVGSYNWMEVVLKEWPELKDVTDDTSARKLMDSDLLKDVDTDQEITEPAYMYLMYGMSLNTRDPLGRYYIWTYFKDFYEQDPEGYESRYTSYISNAESFDRRTAAHRATLNSSRPSDQTKEVPRTAGAPSFGSFDTGISGRPTAPSMRKSSVALTTSSKLNMDYEVEWGAIVKRTGIEPGKKGKMTTTWGGSRRRFSFYSISASTSTTPVYETVKDEEGNEERKWTKTKYTRSYRVGTSSRSSKDTYYFRIRRWIEDGVWEEYDIYALSSVSMIHGGKGVVTTVDVVYDTEKTPGETSLLIPLNTQLFKAMGRVDSAHLGMSACYMVSHYYTDRKQKWYEMGIVKVLAIAAAIAITVYSGGGGSGVGAALVGAIGVTGVAGLILAAIVNIVVGVLVSRLITAASVKIFGDKLGFIIGAIVTTVVMGGLNSYANTGSFDLLNAFNPVNILSMTSAGISGYNQMQQNEMKKLAQEAADMREEFEEMQDELDRLAGMLSGELAVDFTQPIESQAYESLETFLARTTATGIDIAEASMAGLDAAIDLDTQLRLA